MNIWNVSEVTDMNFMFFRASNFNQNLNNWQVGKVTSMRSMFHESAISYPMNDWDVSKVTNMRQMFADTRNFNQPINSWDVSNVTNMSQMFERTRVFNQLLADWDVSGVEDMSGMFKGEDLDMIYNQPLGAWDVSKVTNMSEMFQRCIAFNQPLNSWNVSKVLNMSKMFAETTVFNQPLDSWNVAKVTNLSGMFQKAEQFNQPINSWNTTLVTNMSGLFQNATSFNQNLASWSVIGATNMSNMLSNSGLSQANYDNTLIGWASQNVKSNVSLGALNLNYCDGLTARQALITSKNWNITGDIINCPFVLCTSIISPFNGDQKVPANSSIRWNPAPNATGYRVSIRRVNSGVTYTIANNQDIGNVLFLNFTTEFIAGDNVFVTVVPYNDDGPAVGCQEISFKTVASWVNSPDAFKITIDTRNLNRSSSASNQFRLNLNKGFPDNLIYDFSVDWGDNQYNNNVTNDITHTYLNAGIYTIAIIGNYPAHYYADANRDNFKLLSIDQWGTQEWKSMRNAFYYCQNMVYNATDIPNLSQVTSMQNIFHRAFKFNGNINNWDVSNVTDMTGVFFQASLFNQPLDNWNVSKVTEMNGMFYATPFNQPLTSWDVSNVNKMQDLFNNARMFNQPLNNWNVSKVINM
ncbi:MAG TPA: BspA family leucine-rich repeat surface protein, partial [Flavobacterium sp.]|nr:BspA family leucine-rich repeat surface protein [Flavobacterium sp.]